MSNVDKVTIVAPAKVNLYLGVLGRRPDGYHDLQSVMQALELGDTLTLTRQETGVSVTCDHTGVPPGPGNIAHRAALALLTEFGVRSGVRVHIEKCIPVAAGLGGGSSDAAAALKGVRALFGLDVTDVRLREIGLGLGADVPFFLSWPTALACGVGEELSELPPLPETWLVLVNPGFAVSTAWVYSELKMGLTKSPNSITLPPFEGRTLTTAPPASYLHNDLERVTVGKYPQIKEIKERLLAQGASGALMSGSGPTVFGLFPEEAGALRAALSFDEAGWTVIATRTINAWPVPVTVVL